MTPHNKASKYQIARIVLMPGDPLRAKYIAQNFLDSYQLVNDVRNMYAYTGFYKGVRITIMAHGMGNPSIGIYSYELFKFYDVDTIIRIGSCGALLKEMQLKDIVVASKAVSCSPYAYNMGLIKQRNNCDVLTCDPNLYKLYIDTLKELKLNYHDGMVYSSDAFYGCQEVNEINELKQKQQILAAEMEAFALYTNAQVLNKHALTILSVSDSIVNHTELNPLERQTSFNNMIKSALELALKWSANK